MFLRACFSQKFNLSKKRIFSSFLIFELIFFAFLKIKLGIKSEFQQFKS